MYDKIILEVIVVKKVMSYIFLKRDENRKTKKGKEGNYVLDLGDTLYSKLNSIYDIQKIENNPRKEIESFMKRKQCGTIQIKHNNKIRNIEFEISSAKGTYYLDIISNEKNLIDNISVLEKINNDIVNEGNIFDNKYVSIISYDSISEYYCSKIYPKLNLFERRFRKLLLITYTARFKKAYFEMTVSEDIRNKVKKNIGSKSNEERLKKYLYSLEFGTMRELLFEKSWTEYDERELDYFLEDNKDLNKLTNEELRKIIKDIHPKSDWERLFLGKGFDDDFEETIKTISKFRNSVAHCKFFYKEDYIVLKDVLNKTNKTIDSAIVFTESEEFSKLNSEEMNRKMKIMMNKITSWTKQYTEIINNMNFDWLNEFAKTAQKASNKMIRALKNQNLIPIINEAVQDELEKYNDSSH